MEHKFEEDSGNKLLYQVNATADVDLQAVANNSKSSADSRVNASAQEQLQMDTLAEGDYFFWGELERRLPALNEEKVLSDEGLSRSNQTVQSNNIMAPSLIEQTVRASVAEYNTWWTSSCFEKHLLDELLKSRQPGLPRDLSFDNKILGVLVHSNGDCPEQKDENALALEHDKLIGLFLSKLDRGDQDASDASTGQGAKFPKAMRTLLLPFKIALHKQINESEESKAILTKLDVNSMSVVQSFLTSKESIFFFQSSKALYQSKNNSHQITNLLHYVSLGNQDQAEAMIKRDPQLLLASGNVTDGAGRFFHKITALQYAVWALDAHMWRMMMRHFVLHNTREAAVTQVRVLEEEGTIHGRHFDFNPLLTAIQGLKVAHENQLNDKHWQQVVGGAQRLLPDHVVQEYTTPDRPLVPVPDFSCGTNRPNEDREYGVRWWRRGDGIPEPGRCLGRTWAVMRGAAPQAYRRVVISLPRDLVNETRAAILGDLVAITALCYERNIDLAKLLLSCGITPHQAQERRSQGRKRKSSDQDDCTISCKHLKQ